MQGKHAKLVIPFVDTTGNFQEPEFILASLPFARLWAADLYKQLAKTNTIIYRGGLPSDNRSDSDNSNTVIQTTANCFNCGREFEIFNLTICKHCLTSFCDICMGKHSTEPKLHFDAKYLGGHKLYPKSVDVRVNIFSDRIEIPILHLRVSYTFMSNIENADEKKITAKRLFLVGLFAFGWRKKDVYTIIEYLDGFNQKQGLVFDFGKSIQEAQQRIYDRMLASHFARDRLLEQAALNEQENIVSTNNIDNLKPDSTAILEKSSVESLIPKLPDAEKVRENADPLYILKVRFAKGEISKEEYEEMRKLLE